MGMVPLLIGGAVGAGGTALLGTGTQSGMAAQQLSLQKSRDALALAEQERAREKELENTLSRQNAWFAASGADAASGSALSVANAAVSDAEHDLAMIASGAALTGEARALQERALGASSTSGILQQSLLKSGAGQAQSLVTSGLSLLSPWK
ncbi:hypothetical protein [Oleispirillum naphthae]|uniref:hypothetical protein n=1 Tax=Oleispirillum naphthae TaxID=2838853 RepID=UPI0030825225